MSYYVIDGTPVFLTWARYYQLRVEIMNKLDIGDDCFYGIRGWNLKEASLLSSAINDLLQEKKNKDEEGFYNHWVSFEMDKDEASDNVWELLYDYSHLTRNSVVRDVREDESIGSSLGCNTFRYPMARVFALDLMAYKRPFSKWLFGHKRCKSTFLIDSDKVASIKGTLDDFVMIHRDEQIRFASLIELGSAKNQGS
ncbi:MAG TPA: hypothetical protein VN426_09520 [Syntrophomonadaceae bacterium]|nr:hypothetical protein [Syntrophomonadaceae bacterium]